VAELEQSVPAFPHPFIMAANTVSLKTAPASTPKFSGRSDALEVTDLPPRSAPRAHYLKTYVSAPGPVISCSEFVPRNMVEHLMRNKKGSAIGVKFVPRRGGTDAVTNMEGALHTYVVPITSAFMHGDYVYRSMHDVVHFPDVDGYQQARRVVLSALIQPDFEGPKVMLKVAGLTRKASVGQPLPNDFEIISVEDKQDEADRNAYDEQLRLHMIYHLVKSHQLPDSPSVAEDALTDILAQALLEQLAAGNLPQGAVDARAAVQDVFVVEGSAGILSLEILFMTALHQLRNELSALEHVCSDQGYVYTFDPPSIFARMLKGAEILSRCQAAALRALIDGGAQFPHMRAFAFADYADRGIVQVFKFALSGQPHVRVLSKYDLFPEPSQEYSPPHESLAGALLVIHNNSDGFGQNIQTESAHGSLDGMVGSVTSAAASLHRQHPHLLDHVF